MSPASSWDTAWNAAQPRLAALRETMRRGAHRDAPITRVGQLDAELLDQELIGMLQHPLNNALGLIDPSFKGTFEPELTLLIHSILYRLSLWNNGASYGAKLQDLRYTVHLKASSGSLLPSGIPRRVLVIHAALTVVAPYLHARIRAYALSHAWPDAPTLDLRRKAWDLLVACESSYTLISLASFVAFLYNARFRTIADRILGMQLIPSRPQVRRDVSYEFMNRQMVWHSFTEFLLFLVPLINARKLQRRMNRITSYIVTFPSRLSSAVDTEPENKGTSTTSRPQTLGMYHALPEDQCAICAENASFNLNIPGSSNAFPYSQDLTTTSEDSRFDTSLYPIYTAYMTSCGHVYCYHCIAERMMRTAEDGEDAGWECLRCMAIVKEADRYTVEIEDGGSEFGGNLSEYEFSSDFDVDATDLSGSVDSYSESELSDNR